METQPILAWTNLQGAYSFASHRPLLILHVDDGSSSLIVCATCMPGHEEQAGKPGSDLCTQAANRQKLATKVSRGTTGSLHTSMARRAWRAECWQASACRCPPLRQRTKKWHTHRGLAKHAWPSLVGTWPAFAGKRHHPPTATHQVLQPPHPDAMSRNTVCPGRHHLTRSMHSLARGTQLASRSCM